MCINWFKQFKNCDFDINDRERSGPPALWKRTNCER